MPQSKLANCDQNAARLDARGYLNHEKYRVVKLGQKATSKWYNRIESLS